MALFAKFQQARPGVVFPSNPPATSFGGDTVTFSVDTTDEKLQLVVSKANAANVTTEIILQPLVNARRKPQKSGYSTYGFHAFATNALTLQLMVPSGAYAVAVRFVSLTTGQELARVPLGVYAFSTA